MSSDLRKNGRVKIPVGAMVKVHWTIDREVSSTGEITLIESFDNRHKAIEAFKKITRTDIGIVVLLRRHTEYDEQKFKWVVDWK